MIKPKTDYTHVIQAYNQNVTKNSNNDYNIKPIIIDGINSNEAFQFITWAKLIKDEKLKNHAFKYFNDVIQSDENFHILRDCQKRVVEDVANTQLGVEAKTAAKAAAETAAKTAETAAETAKTAETAENTYKKTAENIGDQKIRDKTAETAKTAAETAKTAKTSAKTANDIINIISNLKPTKDDLIFKDEDNELIRTYKTNMQTCIYAAKKALKPEKTLKPEKILKPEKQSHRFLQRML